MKVSSKPKHIHPSRQKRKKDKKQMIKYLRVWAMMSRKPVDSDIPSLLL